MNLSSSNGTQTTIDDLGKAWDLLHSSYLRFKEINDGSYTKTNPPIQFNRATCPELINLIDDIKDIMKKIEETI